MDGFNVIDVSVLFLRLQISCFYVTILYHSCDNPVNKEAVGVGQTGVREMSKVENHSLL